MNAPILRTNPLEVRNRLNELGWTTEEIKEIVSRSVAARRACTPNHPRGTAGFVAWAEGTERMRRIGATKGLERNDDNHISSAYDKARGIKFAILNTDGGTGLKSSQPLNRNPKGSGSEELIAQNMALGDILEQTASKIVPMSGQVDGIQFWYICIYCDGAEIRAEVSWPSVCDNGYITEFGERIIVIGEGEDDGGVRLRTASPDEEPGFDINVTRKQG